VLNDQRSAAKQCHSCLGRLSKRASVLMQQTLQQFTKHKVLRNAHCMRCTLLSAQSCCFACFVAMQPQPDSTLDCAAVHTACESFAKTQHHTQTLLSQDCTKQKAAFIAERQVYTNALPFTDRPLQSSAVQATTSDSCCNLLMQTGSCRLCKHTSNLQHLCIVQ
jgi:hypothetical protein